MRGLLALLLLLPMPSALAAEAPVVVSAAPDSVGVTIYRDNQRRAESYIYEWEDWGEPRDERDDDDRGGFAVIDEIRTIELPPGQVTVRFEGVASGIVPASAILFDTDLKEKNFDARLLSERGLVDAFTGQAVTIRRTDPQTGLTTTERGTIVSQPDRLILHGSAGYEAIQCEGNYTDMLFPGVPVDLTAKPTLSMTTRPDQPGGRMTLHLAYLAANFDWEATYVGTFSPDARELTLSGWLTLESLDQTSFVDASTREVAGVVYRAWPSWEEREAIEEADDPYDPENIELEANCWPRTRTGGQDHFLPGSLPTISLTLAGLPQFSVSQGTDEDTIVVTGSRIQAPATIGDLKFYTIPHPTTVAAQSQKQVRFLSETPVKGETVFTAYVYGDDYVNGGKLLFRFANDERAGLGVPLPLGGVNLFQETRFGLLLIGPSWIRDKAVGEDVEFEISLDASEHGVDFDMNEIEDGETVEGQDWSRHELTVENENDYPVTVELEFWSSDNYAISDISQRIFRRDGLEVWRVQVPAEGERTVRYTSTELPDKDWDF